MLGVTLLSFMVWQHHLFVSGMNAGLGPFYMLTTALISIPAGFLAMPRRVSTYAPHLQALNDFVSSSAYILGFSMLIFIANLVWSLVFVRQPAAENPWASRGLEWQVPTPVPVSNFERIPVITSGPYEYGVPNAPPVADLAPSALPAAGS